MRRSPRKWPRILGLIVLGVIIFIALGRFGISRSFSGFIKTILTATFETRSRTSNFLAKTLGAPFVVDRQMREIGDLSTQVRILTQQNAQLLELQTENAALRRTLNFYEEQKFPYLVSRIIGRVEEGDNTFFLLNRGSKDGAAKGQPIVYDGVLIGKIVKTQPTISIIAPLTSARMKTAAAFAGGEKTAGIIAGELNAGLTMTLIPNDIALKDGMRVITSGLENSIPRGLVIGEVAHFESNSNALFQSAAIKPAAMISSGAVVSIITAHEIQ